MNENKEPLLLSIFGQIENKDDSLRNPAPLPRAGHAFDFLKLFVISLWISSPYAHLKFASMVSKLRACEDISRIERYEKTINCRVTRQN